ISCRSLSPCAPFPSYRPPSMGGRLSYYLLVCSTDSFNLGTSLVDIVGTDRIGHLLIDGTGLLDEALEFFGRDFVYVHALGHDVIARFGPHALGDLTLDIATNGGTFAHGLLLVLRKLIEQRLGIKQRQRIIHVAGQREVVLHVIDLE